jgi:hypothetical protein
MQVTGRAVILAMLVLLVAPLSALAAKTAFRINAMYWRDPHLFVTFVSCIDVTDVGGIAGFSFNGSTNTPIQTDGNGDGLLDQNYILVFDPLDQAAANGPFNFMSGVLCSSPVWQSACWVGPPPFFNPSTYTNNVCPGPVLGSIVHSYTPAITVPSAPCFYALLPNLALNLGGVPINLQGAVVTATYNGNPATSLVNGLIYGFIAEPIANNTILPLSMPVVGGQPLSILFPGGSGNCATWSDKDTQGAIPGWYVYLNFTAVKVPWYESLVAVGDGALALTLDAPHPNPFNPSTEIRYVLPRASRVEISVYDASGRLVSELANEAQVQGDHGVHWNGRDSRGATVGSGVYFVRLTANGETRTQKMVLLK